MIVLISNDTSYSDIHCIAFHSLMVRRCSIPMQNFMCHWTSSSLFWFRILSRFVHIRSCKKWSTYKKVESNKFELANNFLNKEWCCDMWKTFWWYPSWFQKLKINQICSRRYTVLLNFKDYYFPILANCIRTD